MRSLPQFSCRLTMWVPPPKFPLQTIHHAWKHPKCHTTRAYSLAGKYSSLRQLPDIDRVIYSLPPNVDEAELSSLLAQHLSQYAKIHNIKIIHDAKGGVCAFVQCEVSLSRFMTSIYTARSDTPIRSDGNPSCAYNCPITSKSKIIHGQTASLRVCKGVPHSVDFISQAYAIYSK